jgi:hypothetical protein
MAEDNGKITVTGSSIRLVEKSTHWKDIAAGWHCWEVVVRLSNGKQVVDNRIWGTREGCEEACRLAAERDANLHDPVVDEMIYAKVCR